MKLDKTRKKIDKIDNRLLKLLLKRLDLSKEVAQIKIKEGLPVLNLQREAQILERLSARSGENSHAVKLLFSTIFDISRALQHETINGEGEISDQISESLAALPQNAKVACQGVPSSYSDFAARAMTNRAELSFFDSFEQVFEAVNKGSAEIGVVPVENSTAGSVNEVYDLLMKYRFYIVSALNLHIDHYLLATKGAALENIKKVYSHPQALLQCSNFIAQRGLEPIPYFNTAGAAKMVAEKQDFTLAAIASQQTGKEFDLSILAEKIQNSKGNSTRFIAISKKLIIPENADKISVTFTLSHTTGSLYRTLSRFSASGLNLTKIESRPIADKNFEYYFYLDCQGSVRSGKTLRLLNSLTKELESFSFLGNYSEIQL